MNAFANALFTFLFSWMRTVVQGVWSAVASGRFARFFTWLGDSWLWVALFLCLLCTAMDYLIWLIRWRPYWVWKTKWRQFKRRLRGGNRRFDRGYDTGVGLELPPEPPRAEPSDWAEQAAFQQAQPLPAPPRYDAPPERESAYSAAGLPAEAWTPPAVSAAPENAAPYRTKGRTWDNCKQEKPECKSYRASYERCFGALVHSLHGASAGGACRRYGFR